MKKLWQEFKEFALGGDLVTVAVGLVIALALSSVVTSLVDHIIMPIVGIVFGEPSFHSLTLTINDSIIGYGSFITAAVSFLALAAAVYFLIVKPYNAMKARVAAGEEAPASPPENIALLREIRDALSR